jgi:hypothetical protein
MKHFLQIYKRIIARKSNGIHPVNPIKPIAENTTSCPDKSEITISSWDKKN